ncbi:MAG: porin [Sulfurimonas sp.]|nr:porin [Sulfurimonas sp.]MDQ7062250.1 porin [Sulfurimonas sp.]
MYKNKIIKMSLAIVTGLTLTPNAFADDASEIAALKKEVAELRKMTQALLKHTQITNKKSEEKIAVLEETQQTLIDETSNIQTGFTSVSDGHSHSGMGTAASKVYYSKSPLSIGGYGEMMYSSQTGDSTNEDKIDFYRFVPYIGYKFSDNIILNTEIEFEHGGVTDDGIAQGGAVVLEFFYLDFLFNDNFNLRAGNFLVPMGLINEKHEPTLFNTVQRPDTERFIVPSTWGEAGIMAYGDITEGVSYNFAAISALKTATNGSKWIRNGRTGTERQTDPGFAMVGRLDYTGVNGLLLGTSTYLDTDMRISDIHLDYKVGGARAYGIYTDVSRSNAQNIAPDAVDSASGGYLNLSYDVLSLTNSTHSLPVFIQYEAYNPEDSRADGTSGDATKITTLGINYFPHEQVVLKLDYAMKEKANIKDDIASVSMGFIF